MKRKTEQDIYNLHRAQRLLEEAAELLGSSGEMSRSLKLKSLSTELSNVTKQEEALSIYA